MLGREYQDTSTVNQYAASKCYNNFQVYFRVQEKRVGLKNIHGLVRVYISSRLKAICKGYGQKKILKQ